MIINTSWTSSLLQQLVFMNADDLYCHQIFASIKTANFAWPDFVLWDIGGQQRPINQGSAYR